MTKRTSGGTNPMQNMKDDNIEATYPLSPMQQGMLFHGLAEPGSGIYIELLWCKLSGMLDVPAFVHAWQKVVDRHEALRTSFVWRRVERMQQVLHKNVVVPFRFEDWRQMTREEQHRRFERFLEEDTKQGFDFSRAPLMRLALFRLQDELYQFAWSSHHVLMDGWSNQLVLRDVAALYDVYRKHEEPHLGPVCQFRDYVAWMQQQNIARAQTYWRTALSGFTSPTLLMKDTLSHQTPEPRNQYQDEILNLPAALTTDIAALSRQHQVTMNTIVQGAWAILLSRLSREDDIVFGATGSGRPPELDGVDEIVGLFVNTLPVRATIDPSVPALTFLKDLQLAQSASRQFEFTPLVDIQNWSEVPPQTSLFETILVFENFPVEFSLEESGKSLGIQDVHHSSHTNYPLTVVITPGQRLSFHMIFDTGVFHVETIRGMLTQLQTVLSQVVRTPLQPLGKISLLDEGEKAELLQKSRNPHPASLHHSEMAYDAFTRVATQHPDKIALMHNGSRLTYREVNERANRLAHYLIQQGVHPEECIGLCLTRSPEMIISMLGVLKAGCAFVPLDPLYPPERLAFMLEDSSVKILLTQESLRSRLPACNCRILGVEDEAAKIRLQSSENPRVVISPEQIAYVIFTSGSTGRPKGVLLHHAGLSNLLDMKALAFDLKADENVLQFASCSFDASVSEIFPTLAHGWSLCLADQDDLMSPEKLQALIREKKITFMILPPTMLACLTPGNLPSLRIVVSAGESCSWSTAETWGLQKKFMNAYGPTEATVASSYFLWSGKVDPPSSVPIGIPFKNVEIYVVDSSLNLCPIHAPGELCIGGISLARGYLHRPELTAEKFIPNPFSNEKGSRLYRTGDLGRYLPDGRIEYLGRIDHQVKLRGLRIELGEIEACLTQDPSVREAVVLIGQDVSGEKQLVGYVVPQDGVDFLNVAALQYGLRSRLPEYMIPAVFVKLDSIPLSANGKIDRKAIAALEMGRAKEGKKENVTGRTPTEELLISIWSGILGIQTVNVNDNFFALGGHSLRATQLISRLRDVFSIELPLAAIFEMPVLKELARRIDLTRSAADRSVLPPIETVSREQALPLSFAQQRLWFLDQLQPDGTFYNIPVGLRLSGTLDVEALEKSFRKVIDRHEALRTRFRTNNGNPVQEIMPHVNIHFPLTEIEHLNKPEREKELDRITRKEAETPFNLTEGPLLRGRLVRMEENEHVLLMTIHHIITDGWSMGVLVDEIAKLYTAFHAGAEVQLEPLPIQYADYAAWQRKWLQGKELDRQLIFWKDQLNAVPPALELPTDRSRPPVQTFNGATLSFQMSRDFSEALQDLAKEEGVTLFMTLLAGFQVLLNRYSRQDIIVVGSPIANRTRSETERLIGFFVNTLLLKGRISRGMTVRELLHQARETCLSSYAHQDIPFEKLVEELHPVRDLSRSPLFQVAFMLQNTPVRPAQLPGLTITPIDVAAETAKVDLTLTIAETADGLRGFMEYNADLFDADTIHRMIGNYQTLLESMVTDPEERVEMLQCMDDATLDDVLVEWNSSSLQYPNTMCAHEWFESEVRTHPDEVALTFADESVNYATLNERANQLAHRLRRHGIGPESLVGICMERSPDMVTSMLAVWKAGGAFVPLDPSYPKERLAFMIGDAKVSVLLTQYSLVEQLASEGTTSICIDTQWNDIAQESSDNPVRSTLPENLAYVIYTSGSTGTPKGTLLHHKGLCNLATAQIRSFKLGVGKRVLQFSSLSFDASVWETVMALLSGATLCLVKRDELTTGQGLHQALRTNRITTLTLPPSVLAVLPEEPLPDLETIITAGEQCTADLVHRWRQGRDFVNAYGPTETTVCASLLHVANDYAQGPPIGHAIANTQLYVLDRALQPAPIGVPGELCVGGVSVARGYLHRPDLTAEKFVPNPFGRTAGERMYRTGDLCRFRSDSAVEFLGRIDTQVKLRGFRIELGEIETVLASHPAIRDVAVQIYGTESNARLVAYVVTAAGLTFDADELRSYGKKRLPEYMLPAHVVFLAAMPLTSSGKIDKKALPPPTGERADSGKEYVGPRNRTEEVLVNIFAALLQIERVGIHDDFFEFGGHSLLATQFISRVKDEFRVDIPLRALFENPTVASLAEQVSALEGVQSERRTIAAHLENVEQMSDEEVKALLATLKSNSAEIGSIGERNPK